MKSLKALKNWKRSLLTFSLLPLILIGLIYINYGDVYNSFFSEGSSIRQFFILSSQLTVFNSNISLPFIVKILGKASIVYLFFTLLIWCLLFSFSTYIELSQQKAIKLNLLLELVLFTLIFYYFISFANLYIFIIVSAIILFDLTVIILYWIYELKSKQ